jgi:hypothetical protein
VLMLFLLQGMVVLMLLLQNKDTIETIKYCEFAKMHSVTIREIDIAVSKKSPYNIGKSKKTDQNKCYYSNSCPRNVSLMSGLLK